MLWTWDQQDKTCKVSHAVSCAAPTLKFAKEFEREFNWVTQSD